MNFRNGVLAVLAILLWAVPGMSQWDSEWERARKSLKGLTGVVVKINFSAMDALPDDPNERELQQSVETRMQDAGIAVFKRALGATDDRPTLEVSVGFMNFDIYYYSLDVRLALKQKVRLDSQPELNLSAATWQYGGSSLSGGSLKKDQIARFIEQFVCDFREVNPDPTKATPKCVGNDMGDPVGPRDNQPTLTSQLDEELLRASALNEIEEVKSLIAKGADVNARDFADATPIIYAIRGSRKANDTAVITLLLQHGANPNVRLSCRLTPLMYAVQRGDARVVELLMNHGADVNAATPEGFTALMAAAALGSPEAVSLMLKKGANKQARTHTGETALTLAKAKRNNIPPYARYDAQYDLNPEPKLLKAAQLNHDRVIQLLQSSRTTKQQR